MQFDYTDVTHLVTNPVGKHVNVYTDIHKISDGKGGIQPLRVAEMWSDKLGNWYASCWLGDHGQERGIRGGMTAGQVVAYVERHVKRYHDVLCGNCGTSMVKHSRPQDWCTVIDWRTEQLCPACVASYPNWQDWSYDASTRTYRHK